MCLASEALADTTSNWNFALFPHRFWRHANIYAISSLDQFCEISYICSFIISVACFCNHSSALIIPLEHFNIQCIPCVSTGYNPVKCNAQMYKYIEPAFIILATNSQGSNITKRIRVFFWFLIFYWISFTCTISMIKNLPVFRIVVKIIVLNWTCFHCKLRSNVCVGIFKEHFTTRQFVFLFSLYYCSSHVTIHGTMKLCAKFTNSETCNVLHSQSMATEQL